VRRHAAGGGATPGTRPFFLEQVEGGFLELFGVGVVGARGVERRLSSGIMSFKCLLCGEGAGAN